MANEAGSVQVHFSALIKNITVTLIGASLDASWEHQKLVTVVRAHASNQMHSTCLYIASIHRGDCRNISQWMIIENVSIMAIIIRSSALVYFLWFMQDRHLVHLTSLIMSVGGLQWKFLCFVIILLYTLHNNGVSYNKKIYPFPV